MVKRPRICRSWVPFTVEPKICPEAIHCWKDGVAKYEKKSAKLREDARRHMSAKGWKFAKTTRVHNNGAEVRYESPSPVKFYYSLKTACLACAELESIGSGDQDMEDFAESCSELKVPGPRKRGRKRKLKDIVVVSPEEDCVDVGTELPESVPRKTGRPRRNNAPLVYSKKDSDDDSGPESTVSSKLGKRGRPRKNDDPVFSPVEFLEDSDEELEYCPESPVSKLRRGGRPRKNKNLALAGSTKSKPRKGGRPRKNNVVSPVEDFRTELPRSTPRKRGRPRKNNVAVDVVPHVEELENNVHAVVPHVEDCEETFSELPESKNNALLVVPPVEEDCEETFSKLPESKNNALVVVPPVEKDCEETMSESPESPKMLEQEKSPEVIKPGKKLVNLKRLMKPPKVQKPRPRTVLAFLIENKLVKPGAKVHYRSKRIGGAPLARGEITREGIKCDCCSKLFSLTPFEAHAGSTNHRPGANIIIDELGRSISECQREMKNVQKTTGMKKNSNKKNITVRKSTRETCYKSDVVCSLCQELGELLLCNSCPSAYHIKCLGLNQVPDGDWFCPPCLCKVCGNRKFEQGSSDPADGEMIRCEHCEHNYHVGCMRDNGMVCEGKWFCTTSCQTVCFALRGLLEHPIIVGDHGDLTWTLFKSGSDTKDPRFTKSKIDRARRALHKCFNRCEDPYTKRDIADDIIDCKESRLKRLNFRNFYTLILEKEKDIICVATLRVLGDQVAEIPLVATVERFRNKGMCRILMNELENQLMNLGVQRLVLPSIEEREPTWTKTSLGFSKMSDAERLEPLRHSWVYFVGSVMCHKLLNKKNPPATPIAIIPFQEDDGMEVLDDSSGGISIITQADDD